MYVSKGTLVFDGVAISDTIAAARPLGLAHGAALACRRPRQTGGLCRRAAVTAAGLGRILISAAAARVQGSGGAVYVEKGTLVFDRVAISDTRTKVRPLGPALGGPWAGAARGLGRPVGGGGPQRTGGACRTETAAQCTWPTGP